MAKVYIKSRLEPIEVSNEIAKQIKRRWLGDINTGAGKAEKTDVVDLEDWAGEYGQIKSIELDKIAPIIHTKNVITKENKVRIVPLSYQLQEGEKML